LPLNWPAGSGGIITDVFGYRSYYTNFFYQSFVPQCVRHWWDSESMWYLLLMVFAFICRTKNGFESLLIYCGALVAFSPSTANQYLAIPVALAAVFPNLLFFVYIVAATLQLCMQIPEGPVALGRLNGHYSSFAIQVLTCALAWLLWRTQFVRLLQHIGREIEVQLGRNGGGPASGST